jgi:hypothetical protein
MRQHRTDAVSLVFGLIFLIIAGSWVLGSAVDLNLDIPNLGWLLALGLIVLGLLGVVASLRRSEPGTPAAATDTLTNGTEAESLPPEKSDLLD